MQVGSGVATIPAVVHPLYAALYVRAATRAVRACTTCREATRPRGFVSDELAGGVTAGETRLLGMCGRVNIHDLHVNMRSIHQIHAYTP